MSAAELSQTRGTSHRPSLSQNGWDTPLTCGNVPVSHCPTPFAVPAHLLVGNKMQNRRSERCDLDKSAAVPRPPKSWDTPLTCAFTHCPNHPPPENRCRTTVPRSPLKGRGVPGTAARPLPRLGARRARRMETR